MFKKDTIELINKKSTLLVAYIIPAVVAILPIVMPYGSSFSVATILAAGMGLILLCLIPFNFKAKMLITIIPLIVIWFLHFNGFKATNFLTWTIVLIFVYFYLVYDRQKVTYIAKATMYISIVVSIMVILQTIVFYVFKYHIPFVVTKLCLPYLQGTYYDLIETGMVGKSYRPSGLFLEPAHMAEYCGFGLMLILNKFKGYKKYMFAGIVSLGIVCTTSGIGIVFTLIAWILFIAVLFWRSNKKRKIIILASFLTVAGIAVLGYFVVSPFKSAVDRIINGEAIHGRFFWWKTYFGDYSFLNYVVGKGFSSIPTATYFTGMMEILWTIGILGFVCLFAFYVLGGLYISPFSISMAFIFLMLLFFSNMTSISNLVWFFALCVCEKDENITVPEKTENTKKDECADNSGEETSQNTCEEKPQNTAEELKLEAEHNN